MNLQRNRDRAACLFTRAIKLVGEKELDEAIRVLDIAANLNPEDPDIAYEKGYILYMQEAYDNAIGIVTPLLGKEGERDIYYRLVGACWEMKGIYESAYKTVETGLERFPNSGRLLEEMGLLESTSGNQDLAQAYWLRGVEREPEFARNYYRLAKAYDYREEKIPALIYGEVFLNIARKSHLAPEIKKMIFRCYRQSIFIESGYNASLNLMPRLKAPGRTQLWQEFCEKYQLALLSGVMRVKDKDTIRAISRIRELFVEYWAEKGFGKNLPLPLFDFHMEIIDRGFFEAYNYWLMYDGAPLEFREWFNRNKVMMYEFQTWFLEHKFIVDSHNPVLTFIGT